MMANKKQPPEPSDGEMSDFVPAVFAKSHDDAEEFRALLGDHDIPAMIASEDELGPDHLPKAVVQSMTHGVAVMVPEVLLDEASEIIADREDDDDFRVDADEFGDDDDDDEQQMGLDGPLVDAEDDEPLPPGLASAVEEDDGLGGGLEDDDDDDIAGFLEGELEEDDLDF